MRACVCVCCRSMWEPPPTDSYTKCDPEVFWESVIKAAFEHFKVSELNRAMASHERYAFTTSKYVSPHWIFHVSPCQVSQIPFLLIHGVATSRPESLPPPPQLLNQGHGTLFSGIVATGNGEKLFEFGSTPPSCTDTDENNTDRTD